MEYKWKILVAYSCMLRVSGSKDVTTTDKNLQADVLCDWLNALYKSINGQFCSITSHKTFLKITTLWIPALLLTPLHPK